MKFAWMVAMAGAVAVVGMVSFAPAMAGDNSPKYGSKIRGYSAKRGGYSYSYSDTINTYGDSRNVYGSTQHLRDPMRDRQTLSGPFDHGYFFDSGIAPRGGNSPYMN